MYIYIYIYIYTQTYIKPILNYLNLPYASSRRLSAAEDPPVESTVSRVSPN